MEIKAVKDVDIRALSWTIFKATGLNLGGWNNLSATPQTGFLSWNRLGGLTVTCPDATPAAIIAQIQALIAAHNAATPAPPDFPADPPIVVKPDPAIATAAAAVDVATEIAKLFTARGIVPMTAAEAAGLRDKQLALIARAQGR